MIESKQNTLEQNIEPVTIWETFPLYANAHWRPLMEFLEVLSPNNAAMDVKILPLSNYKPSKVMLENGYIDTDGFQHVFVSYFPDFQEDFAQRQPNMLSGKRMREIFNGNEKSSIEICNLWCEFKPGQFNEKQSQIPIEYLIYRYASESSVSTNEVSHKPQNFNGSTKKYNYLRQFLYDSIKGVRSSKFIRDISLGMLNEIWMTDMLNYKLQSKNICNYRFKIAPNSLDASNETNGSGGDILLVRKENETEIPLMLIDAKLKSAENGYDTGHNKIVDCPRIPPPIGGIKFWTSKGTEVDTRKYLNYVGRNILRYNFEDPLLDIDQSNFHKTFKNIVDTFFRFTANSRVRYGESQNNLNDPIFYGVDLDNQIKKLDEVEQLMLRLAN